MVSIEFEFYITTKAPETKHEDDPRWQIASKWKFEPYKISKCLYVYLVPTDWYIRSRKYRTKQGPYPGPIDFRVMKSTDEYGYTKDFSYNMNTDGKYVCFNEDNYVRVTALYGVIGTPCIRSGKKYNMSDPPFDLATLQKK